MQVNAKDELIRQLQEELAEKNQLERLVSIEQQEWPRRGRVKQSITILLVVICETPRQQSQLQILMKPAEEQKNEEGAVRGGSTHMALLGTNVTNEESDDEDNKKRQGAGAVFAQLQQSVLKLGTQRQSSLYYTVLYYTILYYTILYYTILYYTILYYTIL